MLRRVLKTMMWMVIAAVIVFVMTMDDAGSVVL